MVKSIVGGFPFNQCIDTWYHLRPKKRHHIPNIFPADSHDISSIPSRSQPDPRTPTTCGPSPRGYARRCTVLDLTGGLDQPSWPRPSQHWSGDQAKPHDETWVYIYIYIYIFIIIYIYILKKHTYIYIYGLYLDYIILVYKVFRNMMLTEHNRENSIPTGDEPLGEAWSHPPDEAKAEGLPSSGRVEKNRCFCLGWRNPRKKLWTTMKNPMTNKET